MPGLLERGCRSLEMVLAYQDVVRVVGGDAEDRDARVGERPRELRDDPGLREVQRSGHHQTPKRALHLGVFRRHRVRAADDRELGARTNDGHELVPADPWRYGCIRAQSGDGEGFGKRAQFHAARFSFD